MNFKKRSIFHRGANDEPEQEVQAESGGMLAVWGSPGSGKTVAAVKLAKALADKKKNVALLLCDMTPEVYTAYAIVKPCALLLLTIPCLLIFPLLALVVVVLVILTYFKESRKADEKVAERRDKIDSELPRFVATIEQELASSRDVLTILENYKNHAGPEFAAELDVLTADMRSSSYEAALVRFEGRIASPMNLTDSVTIRGNLWEEWHIAPANP